jgi:uncharacterized protein (TIGR02246 family)
MKTLLTSIILGICSLTVCSASFGQEPLTPQQQIHDSAQKFIKTFNRGDAEGVAEFWTTDGDYINETGQRFVGRKAIENEYTAFFAAHPHATLSLAVDSVRLVNDDVAIEDGRATVSELSQGPPTQSHYTTVHVKVDGQWLMSTVRDTRIDLPSNHARLTDLEFLVGTWTAEEHGVEMNLECQWIASKNFLDRTYTVTENNHPLHASREIIGWDPASGAIKSWTFSSDGGVSTGVWTPHDSGWMIESAGVKHDGTATSAVYILSHVDDNAMAWKSVRRTSGTTELPESDEIVLKRKTTKK